MLELPAAPGRRGKACCSGSVPKPISRPVVAAAEAVQRTAAACLPRRRAAQTSAEPGQAVITDEPERAVRRVDAAQQRHKAPAFVFGIVKKYGHDDGGAGH